MEDMRLLYVWARDNGVLSKQGINFDSQYEFQFTEEENMEKRDVIGTLIEDKRKRDNTAVGLCNSLESGVKNIQYVSAIVGNNGVGKTTMLKLLHELNDLHNTDLIVDCYGSVLVVYINDENERKVAYIAKDGYGKKVRIINGNTRSETMEIVENYIRGLYAIVFYSNILASEIDSLYKKFDISTMRRLDGKSYDVFWNEEMECQMKFLREAYHEGTVIPFLHNFIERSKENNGGKVVTISINKLKYLDREIRTTRRSNEDREQDLYVWFIQTVNGVPVYNIQQHVLKCSVVYDLCALTRSANEEYVLSKKSRYDIVGEVVYTILGMAIPELKNIDGVSYKNFGKVLTSTEDMGKLQEVYECIQRRSRKDERLDLNNFRTDEELYKAMIDSVHGAVERIIRKDGMLNKVSEIMDSCHYRSQISQDFEYAINSFIERAGEKKQLDLSFPEAERFFEQYKAYKDGLSINFEFLNFQWKMSAGEAAILNFYARLYETKNSLYSTTKDVILLLDEPDVNLHPSLQQEYMRGLYQFLNEFFKDKNVYVILSTHSPLLLSDIPKRNITFIKKDENGTCRVIPKNSYEYEQIPETFGANINSLYCNSFFLEEGSIGLYAKHMMQYVFSYLKEGENKYELNIKDLIDVMGEPLLKQIAQDQYKYQKE